MDEILNDIQTSSLWTKITGDLNSWFQGLDLTQIVVSLVILVVAFLLSGPIAHIMLWLATLPIRRSHKNARKQIIQVLKPPARLTSILIALLIIAEVVAGDGRLRSILLDVSRSLFVLGLFWALYAAVDPVYNLIDRNSRFFNASMTGLVTTCAKIVALSLGAATILDIWGIKIGPILAGFGLVGAAVALGAQDLFKNLISGIFIVSERRFQNGDWIKVDGIVEGTVDMVGLRTTRIIRFDSSPEYVPNSQLADNPVTNFSDMTYRQISWIVGLTYDTDIAGLKKVRDGISDYLTTNSDYVQPPEAALFVRIDSFGDSSINLMVYCFTRTTDWGEWLKIKEELAYAITDIVNKAGSGLAFPSQTIYLQSWPEGTEFFQPPGQQEKPADGPQQSGEGQGA